MHLAVPLPDRIRDEMPGQMHGLAGAPFQANVAERLRTARPSDSLPPEDREAGIALARQSLATFAAEDLLQDGRHLYRAVDIPLILPGTTPRIEPGMLWADLGHIGVLHTRIEHGAFPHTRRGEADMAYRFNLDSYVFDLARSLQGIDLRDEDVTAFANHAPQGLILLLEKASRQEPELMRHAADLWPFVAEGSIGGIRGQRRQEAVAAIRRSADALLGPGLLGAGTAQKVAMAIAFVDAVAAPSLSAGPVPEADEESLSALSP